jgi:hypothetical protein
MATTTFEVYSPDGFTIENDGGYNSIKEAEIAFNNWAKRFEKQGYYSSNNGRIPLDELVYHCKIIKKVDKKA